jgi:hypothetical protein
VQGKVALFLCEDAPDELHRRQRDINRALCLGMPEIDNSMRFASRKYADNLLALFDRSTGVLKRNALFNSLVSYCKEFGAKLVVVDIHEVSLILSSTLRLPTAAAPEPIMAYIPPARGESTWTWSPPDSCVLEAGRSQDEAVDMFAAFHRFPSTAAEPDTEALQKICGRL